MNKLKLLAIFSLFILLPNVTYADCTKEEKDYFKQVEKEYKVTYKFNQETDDYTLIFYNPYPERYTFLYENSDSNGIDFDYDGNTMILYISGFSSGVYDYEIVGITDTCDDTLKEGTVNLTKRNNYYNDPLCEGIEEFVLCQPTYDKEIDYDTFVSRVNTYKKTKQEKTTIEPQSDATNKKINTIINNILKYIQDNLFTIVILTVFTVAIIVTIILTAKKIKKSRRLE